MCFDITFCTGSGRRSPPLKFVQNVGHSLLSMTSRYTRRCVGDRWVTPNGLVGSSAADPRGLQPTQKKKMGEPRANTWKVFCTGKEEGDEG
jgi:hypothetical protein